MKLLEERIRQDGIVIGDDILKVDRFLNHQMDPSLFQAMAEEWKRQFAGDHVNKILTIEASGIGIACIVGLVFGCPVVFAKKSKTRNTPEDCYMATVRSFTRGIISDVTVSKNYLGTSDRVLIIDDFMATGEAANGLISLIHQANAHLCGVGIAIEKAFQPGGDLLRSEGIKVVSLARISKMSEEEGISFID